MDAADLIRSRHQFARVIEVEDERLPLARAALLIAREEYPGLDPSAYEKQLDDMSRSISKLVGPTSHAAERLNAIDHELFMNRGFHGNHENYYDPRNSFLNDVLDRKTGIPITLSIVYLELCWRHGLAAVGVGLPGHFVIGVELERGDTILIDPFERGKRLDQAACVARVRRVYGNLPLFNAVAGEPPTDALSSPEQSEKRLSSK